MSSALSSSYPAILSQWETATAFISDDDFKSPDASRSARPMLYSLREVRLYRQALFGPVDDRGSSLTLHLQYLVAQILLFLQGSLGTLGPFVGCLGFTVHEILTGQFFSIVLDFSNGDDIVRTESPPDEWFRSGYLLPLKAPRILAVYPTVDCSTCHSAEISNRRYWISWNHTLPKLDADVSRLITIDYGTGDRIQGASNLQATSMGWPPFCCKDIVKMHHRRLRKDTLFQSLLLRKGSHPQIVYEVKAMHGMGLYQRRYYQLVDDQVTELSSGDEYVTKIHAFKNYFCDKHDMWFSVDLFSVSPLSDEQETHKHKMRMSPFTKIENISVAQRFMSAAGFPTIPLAKDIATMHHQDTNSAVP